MPRGPLPKSLQQLCSKVASNIKVATATLKHDLATCLMAFHVMQCASLLINAPIQKRLCKGENERERELERKSEREREREKEKGRGIQCICVCPQIACIHILLSF